MDRIGGKLMEFERFLREKRLVPSDKIQHYSRWADNFLHGIGYSFDRIDQQSFVGFVNRLNEEGRLDWQVKQAEDATRMLVVNFLGLETKPCNAVENPATSDGSWDEALAKMTECLRLSITPTRPSRRILSG